MDGMGYDSIERELHIEATPEVVYQVISKPEHLREWWPDEAEIEAVPGARGVVSFGDPNAPDAKVVPLTVMEADPPRRFSFRWAYDQGEIAESVDSLLVTFELVPSGTGTLLRFTETGFRDRDWQEEVLVAQYGQHAAGWDHFLPRLVAYAVRTVSKP
ncbi:SRPBCC domain-containing protein [Actinomadura sp. NPDC048955]|uniref:SRPBCC domain-containing protein n=1 Tax=Actinomadura sp. NPDC048955 TaxID=3158228 RepID=UPI0033D85E94